MASPEAFVPLVDKASCSVVFWQTHGGTGVHVIDQSGEQGVVAIPEPTAHRVHWFHPDRPVEGTVFVRQANAPDSSSDGDDTPRG
jgi:hypothetical protein